MDKTANSNVANALTPNATANTILPAAHFPTPSPRSPSNSSSDHTGTTSSYDFLYELVQKRITTFSYLKRVHEGRIHWFNTVCLSKEDLGSMYENSRMKKRTGNFFILGCSLASILDISNPQDYVKALNVMLQEFEYHTNDHSKQKMENYSTNNSPALSHAPCLFHKDYGICKNEWATGLGFVLGLELQQKSKITKHEDSSFQEGEYTYLFVPNIPFDLDYFQTFYTLCDMLVEVYNKLLGANNIVATNFIESVLKVDGKFKKIISQVSKEVDTLARNNLKEELRIIDPIIMMSPTNTTSGGGIIANTNNTAIINGNDGLWDEG
ncbi:5687_t:CDS:2 [Dentiscutata erythropus]|uniref:5687_t:CDS:1 n=1 Tax=Dentiscutata erythropus TaxID=1348616 RepID=A0A9N8V6I9_9GLOM|nr:5687_t:CDS:2 [Dentiscutata erythropus]